jgi:hypothetical protein
LGTREKVKKEDGKVGKELIVTLFYRTRSLYLEDFQRVI